MLRIETTVQLGAITGLISKLGNEELVREIALIAEQVFVDQSPTDTGLLRANWFVTEQGDSREKRDTTEHITSNPPPKQATLYLLNNINYALYANVTSYRPNYIENSLDLIGKEIERIDLNRV